MITQVCGTLLFTLLNFHEPPAIHWCYQKVETSELFFNRVFLKIFLGWQVCKYGTKPEAQNARSFSSLPAHFRFE